MLKVCTKTSPEIMQEIFPTKESGQYNLRDQTVFVISHVKSVNCGIEIMTFLMIRVLEGLCGI